MLDDKQMAVCGIVARYASDVEVLSDRQAAIDIVRSLAGKTVGFDIETQRTCDHPVAGLDPRVSAIRLAQFFDAGNGQGLRNRLPGGRHQLGAAAARRSPGDP